MNAESGRLEVALRVFPDDLEEALSRRANRRIDLEKTKDVDDLIVAYLKEVFTVRPALPKKEPKQLAPPAPPPKPTPKPKVKVGDIHWVGKEVEVQAAWLYFEVSLPGGIHQMEFGNRVFFASQAGQINTMTIKEGAFKTSVRFTAEAPTKVIVIPDRP